GVATAGQYANIGKATGDDAFDTTQHVSDTNPDHYFGDAPAIKIINLTNGTDNDSPTGPHVPVGSTVTWTYNVTNPGNVPLTNVVVTDNIAGVSPAYVSGDADSDGLLDTTETWVYTATGIAIAGQYSNIGTVKADDSFDTTQHVTDSNPDNYFGDLPKIKIVKLTNGTDNDSPTG